MKLYKYLKLPFEFDVAKLQNEVSQLSNSNWLSHYQKLHYTGEWSAIPLRSLGGKPNDVFVLPNSNDHYANTIFLEQSTYLQQVLAQFKCPLLSVRLLKLSAGAIIKEHSDADLHFEKGEIRLHIPVVTHPDVEFYLDGERIVARQGQCWYMNFNLPHNIINKSNVDRIHLVIDAEVNDWVKEIFSHRDINVRKEIDVEDKQYSVAEKNEMIFLFKQMKTETGDKLAQELEQDNMKNNSNA